MASGKHSSQPVPTFLFARPLSVVVLLFSCIAVACSDLGNSPPASFDLESAGIFDSQSIFEQEATSPIVDPARVCELVPDREVLDCEVADFGGQLVGWVVAGGPEERHTVQLLQRDAEGLKIIATAGDSAAEPWESARVRQVELTGDGIAEVVFAIRHGDAGGLLTIEVLDTQTFTVTHRALPRGRARLDVTGDDNGLGIDTWFEPSPGSDEFVYERLVFRGAIWEFEPREVVDIDDVPEGDFPLVQ